MLLKALLRLLWDVHTEQGPTPEPVRAALLHGATQCLILLDHCCQGQVKVSQGSVCLHSPLPSQGIGNFSRVWNFLPIPSINNRLITDSKAVDGVSLCLAPPQGWVTLGDTQTECQGPGNAASLPAGAAGRGAQQL